MRHLLVFLPPCVSQRRPHHPTNSSLETRTKKLEHKIVREDQEYDPILHHEEDNPEMHSPPTTGPPGMFWIGWEERFRGSQIGWSLDVSCVVVSISLFSDLPHFVIACSGQKRKEKASNYLHVIHGTDVTSLHTASDQNWNAWEKGSLFSFRNLHTQL